MTIKELRTLPPLAFARLGSASVPQPGYELDENAADPLGFRRIKPTESFIVGQDGTLTRDAANAIFRDGQKIRPVAPFFELFAIRQEDDALVPLTVELLKEAGI